MSIPDAVRQAERHLEEYERSQMHARRRYNAWLQFHAEAIARAEAEADAEDDEQDRGRMVLLVYILAGAGLVLCAVGIIGIRLMH